jgi:hypothetical protein
MSALSQALANDEKAKVGSTQQHLPIKAIHDDVIVLKDGSVAVVLQTTAVNFDLLSENEQLAIISSFAALINSLSFSIQIVIRSKRLDISKYLENIKKTEDAQTNPLLKHMTKRYRVFVETLTSENEVLDKQFYVVVSVSYLEIGIVNNIDQDFNKAITLLIPRRDAVSKMLGRIGLKATQLDNEKLVRLFYDFYNESSVQQDINAYVDKTVTLKAPTTPPDTTANKPPAPTQAPTEQEVEKLAAQANKKTIEEKKVDEKARIERGENNLEEGMQPPHFDEIFLKEREPNSDLTSFHSPYDNSVKDNSTGRPSTPFVVEELD